MQADSDSPELVHTAPDTADSSSSAGSRQHACGLPLQKGLNDSRPLQGQRLISGVDTEPSHLQDSLQPHGSAPDRPVCRQDEPPAPNILQLGSRSQGLRSECNDHQLGQDISICLPSHSADPEGPRETVHFDTVQPHTDSTQVAETAMVPEAPVIPDSEPSVPAVQERSHTDSGQDSSAEDDAGNTEHDSMASFVRAYSAAGLSKSAAALAGEARRPSTRKTYNVRIRKYYSWCRDKTIDPHTATIGEVADFLTWVFKTQQASAHSVRACRTAVAAVHHGFGGGSTVSNSPVLHDLIKGMYHNRPPQRSLVPAWDLPRTLQFLAEPPFEPMDQSSMADLSRKTAFLVAAASGRRVSEIHALSSAEKHITFSREGVHLLPRAGFLAKNQTIDFTPKHIVLPDLRRASGSPDCGPWCPVRALRFYLHRTKLNRGEIDSLFLTVNNPIKKASKQTISRWIISVIRDSIAREESRSMGSHVRAHDLRSQASAWAFYKGASIQDVMEAQGWSSSTTFQSVYLKDVMIRRSQTASLVLSSASSSHQSTGAGCSSSRSGH